MRGPGSIPPTYPSNSKVICAGANMPATQMPQPMAAYPRKQCSIVRRDKFRSLLISFSSQPGIPCKAECRSRMSKPNVEAECRSRMSKPNVEAECRSRMSKIKRRLAKRSGQTRDAETKSRFKEGRNFQQGGAICLINSNESVRLLSSLRPISKYNSKI